MHDECEVCHGVGWRMEVRDGREVAVRCSCRERRDPQEILRSCRLPERYLHCTLDSFTMWYDNPSLTQAQRRTKEFVGCYPAVEKGLLFMGTVGAGKTHLAVAALRELVLVKGARGLYVDFMELIQQLQMSFDGDGASRRDILEPVLGAEVLVLDELGSGKTSLWAMDMLYFVVNSRYLARKVTLATTNYLDRPETGQESLSDRISLRIRSRLHEMCETVELYKVKDYRTHVLASSGRRR